MALDLGSIQNTIGYNFKNVDLLQQAFVRRSYSEENGGQNNEVLEFVGDKALDLAVIRIMMERFGQITEDKDWREFKLRNPKYFQTRLKEGKFTDIKKQLVEKKALSKCMSDLGFHTQLIMGHGDHKNNIQNSDSVKEDLFEAIIGAVAIDSDWDMDNITNVVERMIDFDAFFDNSIDFNNNYVGKLQEWAQGQGYGLPKYEYFSQGWSSLFSITRDGDSFVCKVTIPEIGLSLQGEEYSQAKARMEAAKNAYEYLEDNGYIINIYKDAVGDADYDEPLRQINELYQKGLISKPEYTFTQEYDEDGNPLWTCECKVAESDESFVNTFSSKKEAQRESAYEMLLYLMGDYEEE